MFAVRWMLVWLAMHGGRSFAMDEHAFVGFIGDAISVLFPPLRVSAHLCRLDKDAAVGLSKEMSRRRLAHEIHGDFEGFAEREHDVWDHRVLYLLDLKCDYAARLLRAASASGMLSAPIRWLLLQDRELFVNATDDDESLNEAAETFQDMSAFPDSDVLLARRIEENFMQIYSIYRPSPVRAVVVENRGNWTAGVGVRLSTVDVASRRRMNLQQTPLKSVIVLSDPDSINHLTDYQHKDIDTPGKTSYPWTLHIAERINATILTVFSVTAVVTNSWGYRSGNGSWSGLTGILHRREADMTTTPTFIVKERIGVIQYVQLYTSTKVCFVFRRPRLSSVSNIFVLPFQRSVWLATGALLLLMLGLLNVAAKWEYNRESTSASANYWRQYNQAAEPTLGDNMLVVLGAVAQQGYMYEAYTVPSRIVSLMLLIAVLSLYASYTANIVALLQSTTNSIKTLSDLADSPLKLGAHDTVYNKHYFRTAEDPTGRTLYEKIEPKKANQKPSWLTPAEGVRRVRNELFAFHAELGVSYRIMQDTYLEEEKCGITVIDFLNFWYPLASLPVRSPYLELVKNTALLLHETGLKFRDEHRWYERKPTCQGETNFVSAGFTECYFPLVSMITGVCLSLILCALEILWHKWRSSGNGDPEREPRFLDDEPPVPTDSDRAPAIEQPFDGIR